MRLFLALDLPAEVRVALAESMRRSVGAQGDEVRVLEANSLHVTLVFLGRTARGDLERVWRAASAAVEGLPAPVFTPAGLVGVPRRKARLLALDLRDEDGRAAAIHSRVAEALSRAGLHEPEARPFWPHVTLARARSGGRVRVPDGPMADEPFLARQLTLYSSVTAPTGARYTALEGVGLARAPTAAG